MACETCGSREPIVDYIPIEGGSIPQARNSIAADWRCPDAFHEDVRPAPPRPSPDAEYLATAIREAGQAIAETLLAIQEGKIEREDAGAPWT